MINPINIFNDRTAKASELATLAMRLVIHAVRSNKLNKIDLRKYRGNQEKKEQIRRLATSEALKVFNLRTQIYIVMSQPIKTKSFPKGSIAHINRVELR